jgi:AcrR family transcriptional regulator
MAAPARQRILDATARLLREKGIARLTTREIAQAADAAEGSITKNFGGKLGLLTALLSSDLPETVAWRDALTPPTSRPEDLRAVLTRAADAAIDFYAASLPLIAGAVSDSTLFAAYRETNAANGTGPQVAVAQMTDYLGAWQQQGALDPAADAGALPAARVDGLPRRPRRPPRLPRRAHRPGPHRPAPLTAEARRRPTVGARQSLTWPHDGRVAVLGRGDVRASGRALRPAAGLNGPGRGPAVRRR